ncbi:hypothetical protein [Lactobacillus bombicola]|uniref:Uncharacterized protein n=1 Tax=Lactobacillus bombicola TaxID=1505723 RepID=A0A396SPW0_9LACO|nr:hypothetical protein [Lactobacillus bombicola]RHW53687.1 hypothetical protein DS835_07020 [Lactobacillus bombicola]
MEVKTGKKLSEEIKAIRDEEELRELAVDDPDAILLHDKDESIINSDYAEVIDNAYDDAADYLTQRLRVHHGSLDKLAEELGYAGTYEHCGKNHYWTEDFLDDLLSGMDWMDEVLQEKYDGERLGDIYDDAR